jgi:hypothetical protein
MSAKTYQLLSTNTGVTTLVQQRIFRMGHAPQDVVDPYITWQVIGGFTESYIAEAPALDRELVQIDVWAKDAQKCEDVKNAVLAALEGDGYLQGLPSDSYEEDTTLYRYMLQFHFWAAR